MRSRTWAFINFLALAVVTAAPAATLSPLRLNYFRLPNGLRVVLAESFELPVVTVEVWYHVGGKDEPPGRTGLAHLMEHLMYSGTKKLSRGQFSDYIVGAGGINNAYTTEDATVFWETFPSQYLPGVLWLEADRMQNLEISAQDLRREIEVVKEERRLRFDNVPYGTLLERLYEQAFTVHPYQHLPIGSLEDLGRAQRDEVREFYKIYYVPNNATLVLVGDLRLEQARLWVEKYFGAIPAGSVPPSYRAPPEPIQTQKRILQREENVALPAFLQGYHVPADGSPDSYPLKLASKILSEGESSRLYRRLIYEKQMAVESQSAANFSEDPNLFVTFAILNPGHSPPEAQVEVHRELERLRRELVGPQELKKAKNQIFRDLAMERQTSKSKADALGHATVILKNPALINSELDRYRAVTAEAIQRVAQKYFVPENLTVIEVSPRQKEKELSRWWRLEE